LRPICENPSPGRNTRIALASVEHVAAVTDRVCSAQIEWQSTSRRARSVEGFDHDLMILERERHVPDADRASAFHDVHAWYRIDLSAHGFVQRLDLREEQSAG